MSLPETVQVHIEPNFFRRTPVKKTVTVLSATPEGHPIGALTYIRVVVRCDNNEYAIDVCWWAEKNRASAGAVHQKWDSHVSRRRQRSDSGRVIAIRKVAEEFVAKLNGATPAA